MSFMRDRNARLFLTISVVTGFGGSTMLLVAPVWTLQLTGSSSLAAASGFFFYAPSLLGPPIGAVVDRLPRQRLIIWTCLLMAGLLLTLLAVRSAGYLWLLYAVMLGFGLSYLVRHASEAALIPACLPLATLGQINGLRTSAQEGMKLIAPLAGAGLFTLVGGPWVAVLVAATMTVAALLYAKVRVHRPPASAAATNLREPIRYLLGHRGLRKVVLTSAVSVAMSGFCSAAIYTVITHDLHRAPAFAGVLGSAQGAGSILGGILAGRLLDRPSAQRNAANTGAAGALLFAAAAILWSVPATPVVLAGSFLAGAGLLWTVVAATTAVQRFAPTEMAGGVASTADMLIFAPISLSIPAGAALVAFADHRLCLAIAAAATLAAAMIAATRVTVHDPLAGDHSKVNRQPASREDLAGDDCRRAVRPRP